MLCHHILLLATGVLVPGATAEQPEVKEPRVLRGHTGAVAAVVFVGDGKILASGSSDKTVRLWNVSDGMELAKLTGHSAEVQTLAITRDGKLLASGDKDGGVILWDTDSRKEVRMLKGEKVTGSVLKFSPDGKILAAGGGGYDEAAKKGWGKIRLLDPATGQETAAFEGLDNRVTSIAFSPDGKLLASCCANGSAYLWEVDSARKKFILGENPNGGCSVTYSPDGKMIVCGSFVRSTVVKIWDASNGKEIHTIEKIGPSTLSLAFLPDSKTLLVGGFNQNRITDKGDSRGIRGLVGCGHR
ncbi:MAG TPA: WD40 repeat domain-containing protein [Gemmata sp.]|jgi:WD40 repeat protein|nr:WD40 repeat domain-containing protein [Gemmata sp.]